VLLGLDAFRAAGPIPPALGGLTALEELHIWRTMLDGELNVWLYRYVV